MTFFTDKWTIAKIDLNNMILVRKSKNNIMLERIIRDATTNNKEIIAKDVLEEYDIGVNSQNNIYLLYQNQEMHLILNVLKENKKEEIKLTSEPLAEVFDLNILIKDNTIHILYLIRVSDKEEKYKIYHHYYNGNKWDTYIVEEIIAKKVLNPIKPIQIDNNIILSYFKTDKEIELKEFNTHNLEWSSSIKLADTTNDKVFLDMLKIDDTIHLTYCEFIDGNLMIKYTRLFYDNGDYRIDIDKSISNEGSPSHPTIILYDNKLWITWIELSKVMSRYSENMGENWGNIYMWKDSKNIDFVRYKYLNTIPEEGIKLGHSFGKVYPEIVFMGFGPTDKAEEVPIKKKMSVSIPRI